MLGCSMELHLSLSARSALGTSLQRSVAQQLKDAILRGRLSPRERLPATRELAARLGVGRNTVLAAYEQLVAEGFLEARVGDGTYVSSSLPASPGATPRAAPAGDALRPRAAFRQLVADAEAAEASEVTEVAAPPPAGRRARLASPPAPAARAPRPRWDFRLGTPDASLFPWDEWRRLLARQFRRPRDRTAAHYLPPEGDPRARAAIAHHLARARAVAATASDVLLTSGTQQALDLIGRVLLEPAARSAGRASSGSCVAVEDPGYLPARQLFRSLGARVVPVPVDDEGLIVERLPPDARLVYVTPSHQFPLGVPMSLPRRLALLAWAERHGAAILEDDYDSELRHGGRPLEPLQSLDRSGRVLYVGTFSKVLVPSLRLGFLVAPPSLLPALRQAKRLSDGHGAPEPQRALAELFEDGAFSRHLRRVLRVYSDRRARLLSAIAHHLSPLLGARLHCHPSVAGLHHTISISSLSASASLSLTARAASLGLALQPLAPYNLRSRRSGFALGFGAIAGAAIDEGIHQLATLLAAVSPERSRPRATRRDL